MIWPNSTPPHCSRLHRSHDDDARRVYLSPSMTLLCAHTLVTLARLLRRISHTDDRTATRCSARSHPQASRAKQAALGVDCAVTTSTRCNSLKKRCARDIFNIPDVIKYGTFDKTITATFHSLMRSGEH